MNGVEIGDSCTIQNCVIGEGTIIGNNCNINECFTAKGVRIPEGSKLKNETIESNDVEDDENDEGETEDL